jgi:hypothetical protein
MEYQNMRCDFHKYLASVSMYGVYSICPILVNTIACIDVLFYNEYPRIFFLC